MSIYSTDSLEKANFSPRTSDSSNEDSSPRTPKTLRNSPDFPSNVQSYLNPSSTSSKRAKNTRSNETASSTSTVRDTGRNGSRNAIIASRGSVDVSKRGCSLSSRHDYEGDVDVRKMLSAKKNARQARNLREENRSDCEKHVSRCISNTTSSRRCSPPAANSTPMKPDKKLGNVLAPRIQEAKKPRSYLELYRRRFSVPQYRSRSPEGSTLSICGDSQLEELTEDDTSLPGTPRDDRSELSFYRRVIEESWVARPSRSSKTVHQRPSNDSSIPCLDRVKANGEISREKLGYRPYTIEEYRSLPVPKLDRSLGPDKVEVQAKREWLMRRRSYGNSVSARNRQQILSQAQQLQEKDEARFGCRCTKERAVSEPKSNYTHKARTAGRSYHRGSEELRIQGREKRRYRNSLHVDEPTLHLWKENRSRDSPTASGIRFRLLSSLRNCPLRVSSSVRRLDIDNRGLNLNHRPPCMHIYPEAFFLFAMSMWCGIATALRSTTDRGISRRGFVQKSFLPPLKDQKADAKAHKSFTPSAVCDLRNTAQQNGSTRSSEYSKKTVERSKISPGKPTKFERTSSFCSSLNSHGILEDSYLESLRKRHHHEKEMVDRIINQAGGSLYE